ncbi:MAG: hypothetical protein ACRCVD_13745 [Halioglobus sp.]
MSDKQYGHDDARDYEPYFSRHLMAMTSEDLHGKGEIACELAYRDARIAELKAENQRLREALTLVATCGLEPIDTSYRQLAEKALLGVGGMSTPKRRMEDRPTPLVGKIILFLAGFVLFGMILLLAFP